MLDLVESYLMPWKPEREIWICSGCGTFYNLPADAVMLEERIDERGSCCAFARRMDLAAFKAEERQEDAQREPWQAEDDGYGRGVGFYFEIDDD